MLRQPLTGKRRVLITLDAVGGVWRYGLDLARGLDAYGAQCLLVGFGPEPSDRQWAEYATLTNADVIWTHEPIDWMVTDPALLHPGVEKLAALGREWDADVLHLNVPSQAAGLTSEIPLVVASHSCVPTWWDAVHGGNLPATWTWQLERNRQGLRRADAVVVPSQSHGAALGRIYGELPPLHVVHNGIASAPAGQPKDAFILAVGRWWDPGKNGGLLDAAASAVAWPIVLAGPLHGPNGQRAVLHTVHAEGPLRHEDVLSLMQQASIFAAPSLYEPFGLAVAEAAMRGAALVLADIPSFRELWQDAALFVDANDVNGWSRTLSTLAGNAPQRRQLAAKATARALRFTLPRQAMRMFRLYSDLGVTVPA